MDPEIGPGDTVEVFGLYVGDDYVTLSGSGDYYLTKTSLSNQPSVTVRYPNGGESIMIGTQVQVSAHATDDNAVTGVTFYYSSDGGSNWDIIGEGARISGTAIDGVWNSTWNTDGLSAGTNYMVKVVASDGTFTSEDRSDSTFFVTKYAPSGGALAYIYSTDATSALSYKSLLDANGYSATLIPLSDVATTDFSTYAALIIGSDTGSMSSWSDIASVSAVQDSSKPIIGLGEGGYALFGQLELDTGHPQGWHGSRNSIYVVDASHTIFKMPNAISIPRSKEILLYSSTEHVGIYLPEIPSNIVVLGREVDSTTHYPLTLERDRYLLWGFTASPESMTEVGKDLFINVVGYNYEKGNRLSDWPMSKHDAARTGYNADETKLSPPLVKSWEFEGISGDVFDTISTAGGTIYIGMDASTEGLDSNKVYAIDGATGLKRWEFILDAGGRGAMGVTPAIANGLVYFGGQQDDKLYALDAKTGQIVWEFTGVGTMYCSHPAVIDGVVYAKGKDTLYALDAYTGVKKWEFTTAGNGRSSPAVGDGTVYIGSSDGFLYAIDSETGKEKWNLPDSSGIYSNPVIWDDTVYINQEASSSTTIKALDAETCTLKWTITRENELGYLGDGALTVANNVLYASIWKGENGHGKLYAVDASTGSELWAFDLGAEGITASAVANGAVYVSGRENKMIYALDATTGVEKWHYKCDGTISLSPIIADGVLYVGTWSKLYAFVPK
jgi:outer membrane protein assembly factor BamB